MIDWSIGPRKMEDWSRVPHKIEYGFTFAVCRTCRTYFITTVSFPVMLWSHWLTTHDPRAAGKWAELRQKAAQ